MCSCEDLEELLANSDRLAFVADLLLPLPALVLGAVSVARKPTSGSFGSFGRSWNIFFTQNLRTH